VVATAPGRDLRLDLFRGLALWLIFLDHVPNNIVAWFTIRNYGFSDATDGGDFYCRPHGLSTGTIAKRFIIVDAPPGCIKQLNPCQWQSTGLR
jgi:hypothetical protein